MNSDTEPRNCHWRAAGAKPRLLPLEHQLKLTGGQWGWVSAAERKNPAEATTPEAAQRSSEAAQSHSQQVEKPGCEVCVAWNRSDSGCVLTSLRGPTWCQAPGMERAECWNQSASFLLWCVCFFKDLTVTPTEIPPVTRFAYVLWNLPLPFTRRAIVWWIWKSPRLAEAGGSLDLPRDSLIHEQQFHNSCMKDKAFNSSQNVNLFLKRSDFRPGLALTTHAAAAWLCRYYLNWSPDKRWWNDWQLSPQPPESPSKRKTINKFISQMKSSLFRHTFATSCLDPVTRSSLCTPSPLLSPNLDASPVSRLLRWARLKVELSAAEDLSFTGFVPVKEDGDVIQHWLSLGHGSAGIRRPEACSPVSHQPVTVERGNKTKSGLFPPPWWWRDTTDGWRTAAAAEMDTLNLLVRLSWHLC